MKIITLSKFFAFILFFSLFSCSKPNSNPNAGGTTTVTSNAPGTGGISGSVSPSNVVCRIDVVNVLTGIITASTTSNSTDGSFSISNLAPAKYNVRATPTPDPNNLGIHTWVGTVVSSGAVSSVGPISF